MTAIVDADPIDELLEQVVRAHELEVSRWRSRLLAGIWHRVYVIARGRGDQELAEVALAERHYHRGRRAAVPAGSDIGSAVAKAISRARAHLGEHEKGSMGGSG